MNGMEWEGMEQSGVRSGMEETGKECWSGVQWERMEETGKEWEGMKESEKEWEKVRAYAKPTKRTGALGESRTGQLDINVKHYDLMQVAHSQVFPLLMSFVFSRNTCWTNLYQDPNLTKTWPKPKMPQIPST